ncbi:MAG TPA: hypothetical protein VF596_16235 [Pyrinomonadaceae bacterium]|jgi:hypothetical protein
MAKRKEIKCWYIDVGADWFLLNSTPKKKKSKYYHEVAAADLFVAYFNHASKWFVEYPIKDDWTDRGMDIFEKRIYFEVDMCTENIQVLYDKIENAIAYSEETKKRCYFIYTFLGEQKKIEERGKKLLLYLATKRRGDQFTIANHPRLIADPFGEVLINPKGELRSLSTLL